MRGFATRAVHGAGDPGVGGGPEYEGALRPPVFDTVSFALPSAHESAAVFAGRRPGHIYSRISNPTVSEFERRVLALSGGRGVVALASGMAAISSLIITLAETGANIVASRYLFGNTASLLAHTLAPWGLETRFVDTSDLRAVEGAMDGETRMLFCESITNPQLELSDIPALAALCRARKVPLVVDNTAPTFYLCRAGELGADIEIVSSTKFISGGGSSVGGLIIDHGSFPWCHSPRLAELAGGYGPFALLAALRREVARNLGPCLAPHNAYLQCLGLETLALRVDRCCENAMALALFLSGRPEVRGVNYPGLPAHPQHSLAVRLLDGGYGGILTFELADRAACFSCLDKLRLIRRATNINDNKSLAIHPASTIFAEFSAAERAKMGVGEGMIRVSAGIEEAEDLRQDLEMAL